MFNSPIQYLDSLARYRLYNPFLHGLIKTPIRSVTYLSLFASFNVLSGEVLAAADSEKRLITIDDQTVFQSVASPVFSPDL